MKGTHHINLTPEFAEGIDTWLISGEPERTEKIYNRLDSQDSFQDSWIETGRKLPVGRGVLRRKIKGRTHEVNVGVATSGMGLGSAEIVTMEMVDVYIKRVKEFYRGLVEAATKSNHGPINILRTGTAGSHQKHVYGGHIVIATDTYAVAGAVDDLIETPHEDPLHHFRLGYLQEVERVLEELAAGQNAEQRMVQLSELGELLDGLYPDFGQSFDFETTTTERGLRDIRYRIAREEVYQTHPCHPAIIECMSQSARNIRLNNYHLGPVFGKETLFSEAHEAFEIEPEGRRRYRLQDRGKVLHNAGVCASEMEIPILTSISHLANLKGFDVRIGGAMAVVNNPENPERSVNPLFADNDIIQYSVGRAIDLALETAGQIYEVQLKKTA